MNAIADTCGADGSGRPLVAGTLRGYRTWRPLPRGVPVPSGRLPLTSVVCGDVVWATTMTAECRPPLAVPGRLAAPPGGHASPYASCQCGIYAWYRPDDTRVLSAPVFGVVEAAGTVLLGDHGFRAYEARIVAVATRNRRIAEACAASGVAVFRRRRDLVREYPPDDVRELLHGDGPAVVTRPPARSSSRHRTIAVGLGALPATAALVMGVLGPSAAALAIVVAAHALLIAVALAYVP